MFGHHLRFVGHYGVFKPFIPPVIFLRIIYDKIKMSDAELIQHGSCFNGSFKGVVCYENIFVLRYLHYAGKFFPFNAAGQYDDIFK